MGQRIAQEGVEETSIPWNMLSLDHLLHYSSIPGIIKKQLEAWRLIRASTTQCHE